MSEYVSLFVHFPITLTSLLVYEQGSVGDLIYVVMTGAVAAFTATTSGLKSTKTVRTIQENENHVGLFRVGDAFGEEALLPSPRRKYTVIADVKTTIITLNNAFLGKLLMYKDPILWHPTCFRAALFKTPEQRSNFEVKLLPPYSFPSPLPAVLLYQSCFALLLDVLTILLSSPS